MSINVFLNIIMAAMIIEALVETLKLAFKSYEKYTTAWSILNLCISIVICYDYNLDLLSSLGFVDHIPYLGVFLTGILISRGSNYIHDLVNRLSLSTSSVTATSQSSTEIKSENEQTITKI